jgi:hypothetical protein
MDNHFDPVVLRLIDLLKKARRTSKTSSGISLHHRIADADAGQDQAAGQLPRPVPLGGFPGGQKHIATFMARASSHLSADETIALR